MTNTTIEVVAGCALVMVGLICWRFGWGGFGASRRDNGPSIPTWLGRALFIIGGLWFIYVGVRGT